MTHSIRDRLRALDWKAIEHSLDDLGYATTPRLLTPEECRALVNLYGDEGHFRSRVDMARFRFGVGDYAYFDHPLPAVVRELRTHAYPYLAPMASRWVRALHRQPPFPSRLAAFTEHCHAHGQKRPTPLLLHYEAEGYNCLHQDLYGGVVFPLQITVMLSRRGIDYEGGEFLLVEQRPRAQSRGSVIAAEQGELIVFPCAERPGAGKRGPLRLNLRHGVSRVTRGERFALGIIFHDAR